MKRFIAWVLCFALCFSLVPAAGAEEEVLADVVPEDTVGGSAWEEAEEGAAEALELSGTEAEIGAAESVRSAEYADVRDLVISKGGFFRTEPSTLALSGSSAGSPDRSAVIAELTRGANAGLDAVDVSGFNIPAEDAASVYADFLNSSPTLFFVSSEFGYSHQDGIVTEYELRYEEIYLDSANTYETAVSKILRLITDDMTDVQKALTMHDYLTTHVAYDLTYSHYDAYSAIVGGSAVCQGYAEAYRDLMNRCGLECIVVISRSMNHAWNILKIDGQWYHVDVTWDDPIPNLMGRSLHDHFLVSDTKMTEELGHYGWSADCACTSTLFDAGQFWTDISSMIYIADLHNAYYLGTTGSGKNQNVCLIKRDMPNNTSTTLYSIRAYWPYGSNGWWIGSYSYLSYYDQELFFNTPYKVIGYSLKNGSTRTVYTYTGTSDYIYGCMIDSGLMNLAVAPSPHEYSLISLSLNGLREVYTVTYDANGGSDTPASQFKIKDEALTLSADIPTRDNYIFLGWATDSNATEAQYQPGGQYTANSDVMFYAVWQVEPNDITVASPCELESAHNYKNNCDKSWTYTDSGAQSMTLTFDPRTETEQYFDLIYIYDRSNTQVGVYSGTALAGKSVTIPGDTVCIRLTSDFSNTYWGFKVTDYSAERDGSYTVRYKANGGIGAPFSQTKTEGAALTLSAAIPIRPGYSFKGWATSADAGEAQYQPGGRYTTDADMTLFAVWEKLPPHIPGDVNGDGSVNALDLLTLQNCLSDSPVSYSYYALDIDNSGKVNGDDLTRLMRYLAGAAVEIF